MAIIDIPTGNLPYEEVEELPQTGVANKIYGLRDTKTEIVTNYRYHNSQWQEVDLGAQLFGFLFADYQESVQETVTELETTVAEQAAMITELEEAVFPVVQTSFDMSITSLMQTELDLYDENDEIVPNQGISIEYWEEPQELTYQNEVRKGTYYLKNTDGYALGKPNGEIQPLVCEGGIVQLGSVELIMIATAEAPEGPEEGDEF